MSRANKFLGILGIPAILAGCATAQKAPPPAADNRRAALDQENARLKTELEEQKVRTAEAEARAAKAENDLRELEAAKGSKPKDPYLK